MTKMHHIASFLAAVAGLSVNRASAVTYFSENFDNQTIPLNETPQIGDHLNINGTTNPEQFTLVTTPAITGNALRLTRVAPEGSPTLNMWGTDGAMVDGATIEYGVKFQVTSPTVAFPIQFQSGMANGGVGRLVFWGIGETRQSPPQKVGNIFYTNQDGSEVVTNFKPDLETWYGVRMVMTLDVVDFEGVNYMTGMFDLFAYKVGEAETQLANDIPMSYGEIPADNPLTPTWNESTAPFLKIQKGNGSGATFFDDIFMRSPVTAIPGDANSDGKVDTRDFNILAGHFGQSGQTFATGDFSGNGTVGSEDFNIYVAHHGEGAGAGPMLGSVVPEPASVSVVALALAAAARRRRNRAIGEIG